MCGLSFTEIKMAFNMRNRYGWLGNGHHFLRTFLNRVISHLPRNTVPIKYQDSALCYCGTAQFILCYSESTCYLLSLSHAYSLFK